MEPQRHGDWPLYPPGDDSEEARLVEQLAAPNVEDGCECEARCECEDEN